MSQPTPHVIAISGQIGSGKTTLTRALARQLGWPAASYGDVVRIEATARNLIPDRQTLQAIGAELAADWPEFTRRVLQHARWQPGRPAIIDGIRHIAAVEHLRREVGPVPVLVGYLAINPNTALGRSYERDGIGSPTWNEHQHPVELDLNNVRDAADLVVSGSADPHSVTRQVLDRVHPHGIGGHDGLHQSR
ncbi:MAG: AAA family ATPase [Pseudonocardiales bacterium]